MKMTETDYAELADMLDRWANLLTCELHPEAFPSWMVERRVELRNKAARWAREIREWRQELANAE